MTWQKMPLQPRVRRTQPWATKLPDNPASAHRGTENRTPRHEDQPSGLLFSTPLLALGSNPEFGKTLAESFFRLIKQHGQHAQVVGPDSQHPSVEILTEHLDAP